MNKQLSQEEISDLMSPVAIEVKPMTRWEKLTRLAKVIEDRPAPVYIFHGIEYMHTAMRRSVCHPYSAFSLALRDQALREAGLKPDLLGAEVSVEAGREFFELSVAELHEFSCDCGGAIGNKQMAERITKLAGPPPVPAGVIDSRAWTG